MADSATWFRSRYVRTPPMSFQASQDWDTDRGLSAQWYASCWYRVGFLGEAGRLRIRDLFLYREAYPSRYFDRPMEGRGSTFDALPVLFPQAWGQPRPFLRLRTPEGREPEGMVRYTARDDLTARAELWSGAACLAAFTMEPHAITLEGPAPWYLTACRFCAGWRDGRWSWSTVDVSGTDSKSPGAYSVKLAPKAWKLSRRRGQPF
ncbi:MAG: hypothetical protein ACLSHU_09660 [Oscillospiraceae bacterium]